MVGIPGFHTRTVYISVSSDTHLELFEFFNPQALPAVESQEPKVGFAYSALEIECIQELANYESQHLSKASTADLLETPEEAYLDRRTACVRDPNGMDLKAIEPGTSEKKSDCPRGSSLLYPAFYVTDLNESCKYYQDVLELEIADRGVNIADANDSTNGGKTAWILFKARDGICLKLLQPLDQAVLPARPWRMERVGYTHFALAVENLGDFYEKLAKRNVAFNSPLQTVGIGPHKGGLGVYSTSPEGFTIEFLDSPLTRAVAGKD